MKQAKDHLAKVRTQGVEGSYIAPERGRTDFRFVVRRVVGHQGRPTGAHPARGYERDLRLHIRPRFDRRPAGEDHQDRGSGVGRRDALERRPRLGRAAPVLGVPAPC